MTGRQTVQNGFTLLELLVTIVIIAILAAIALSSYLTYTKKAYYSEIIHATAPFKVGVASCYQTLASFTGCSGGENGVPTDITTATSSVASLTTADGIITVMPVAQHDIDTTDTYILSPTAANGIVTWIASGQGVDKGYAN